MISKAVDTQPENFQVPNIYGSGGGQRPDPKRYQTRCDLQPTLVAGFSANRRIPAAAHGATAFLFQRLAGKHCWSRNRKHRGPP